MWKGLSASASWKANIRHLAQGAVFAAKVRERALNPALHTELAYRLLCGLSADQAAAIADRMLPHASEAASKSANGSEPSYEVWRWRIRMHFSGTDDAGQEEQIEHNGLVTRKRWDETEEGATNA